MSAIGVARQQGCDKASRGARSAFARHVAPMDQTSESSQIPIPLPLIKDGSGGIWDAHRSCIQESSTDDLQYLGMHQELAPPLLQSDLHMKSLGSGRLRPALLTFVSSHLRVHDPRRSVVALVTNLTMSRSNDVSFLYPATIVNPRPLDIERTHDTALDFLRSTRENGINAELHGDAAYARRLRRKVDRLVMPFLWFVYGVTFLDKVMLNECCLFPCRDSSSS